MTSTRTEGTDGTGRLRVIGIDRVAIHRHLQLHVPGDRARFDETLRSQRRRALDLAHDSLDVGCLEAGLLDELVERHPGLVPGEITEYPHHDPEIIGRLIEPTAWFSNVHGQNQSRGRGLEALVVLLPRVPFAARTWAEGGSEECLTAAATITFRL